MKIITIEEEAWIQLNNRIDAIASYLKRLEDTSYDDLWLNNHEVCQYLHISEKTLWRMRTKGEISYSKIYGQYFYTIRAIKDILNASAIQSSDEYVAELMAKGKSYIEKGRKLKIVKNRCNPLKNISMNIDRMEFLAWMERIMDRFDMLSEHISDLQKQRNSIDGEELLDNQDLMQMLKISNRSLQRYRTIGKLPYYTISGKLYYKLSDVHQFIRESFTK